MATGTGRFDYVKYDEQAQKDQAAAKTMFEQLEAWVLKYTKPGRSQSEALTCLETTYMWVGKALRDDQIARNGSAPLQEERTNS